MKVFWSWQSDRDPKLHHYFVRDALKEACKLIAIDPEYTEAERPEVDHDTKNVAGTPDITATILEKIAAANVFVADMTPVGTTDPSVLQTNVAPEKRSDPKYLQNPNVMSELGYAEHALSQSRIILVANGAHYPGPVALPFDWRHRSGAKVYNLSDGATNAEIAAERKRFADVLKSCIKPILAAQQPPMAPPAPIVWQQSSDADPTVWKGGEEKLQYRNTSMGEPTRNVQLQPGRRIFARIAPTDWPTPARIELVQRVSDIGLKIRGSMGDYGLNNEGALSVWGRNGPSRDEMVVSDGTQWFQKTGEIWAVNSSCFGNEDGRLYFASALPFAPLDDFLRKSLAAIKAMGGAGPVGIRLGAGDLTGTVFPGAHSFESFEAVESYVNVEEEREHWTPSERRKILLRFWNGLLDAYGRPTVTMGDFERAAQVPPVEK
ncbi:hypothetical protein [Mesorhizobium sp.]|uniref:hypothetical protein n=1 Tax=Mesorhizobium sp. TaxID=1871066 RepID=UPI000FE67A96|nr:hypothetical protein [Mesorhizobium sp.]RWH82223.1 MAG: hypothetical protein EOQ85_08050 [Mesorhizobium sp.]RWH98271.1 MAG: hypothetical protein EOQ88_13450 [Mesorhizobium sp.]RWI04722.1 MAG: hypothetical protein EOQ89_09110 [Mesorhizobium sp.]RWI21001.1 MAG: hypothetical protein EOQ91_12640 [Mesorhizobium sp.]TJV29692.1 MAG: hypothetical protein E5X87_30795 [Mesorhizobium sp.]